MCQLHFDHLKIECVFRIRIWCARVCAIWGIVRSFGPRFDQTQFVDSENWIESNSSELQCFDYDAHGSHRHRRGDGRHWGLRARRGCRRWKRQIQLLRMWVDSCSCVIFIFKLNSIRFVAEETERVILSFFRLRQLKLFFPNKNAKWFPYRYMCLRCRHHGIRSAGVRIVRKQCSRVWWIQIVC